MASESICLCFTLADLETQTAPLRYQIERFARSGKHKFDILFRFWQVGCDGNKKGPSAFRLHV